MQQCGGNKTYAHCQMGDAFAYVSYPQGKNGELKLIEWRLLARESGRLLVIAEYGLESVPYNKQRVDINWSQYTLCSWLNGDFKEKAFNVEEQQSLVEVTLANPDSPAY